MLKETTSHTHNDNTVTFCQYVFCKYFTTSRGCIIDAVCHNTSLMKSKQILVFSYFYLILCVKRKLVTRDNEGVCCFHHVHLRLVIHHSSVFISIYLFGNGFIKHKKKDMTVSKWPGERKTRKTSPVCS